MQLTCPKCGGAGPFQFVSNVTISRRVISVFFVEDAGEDDQKAMLYVDDDDSKYELEYGDDDCPRIECNADLTDRICRHVWELPEDWGLEFLLPGQVGYPEN